MSDIRKILSKIIATRLEGLPTEELLRMYSTGALDPLEAELAEATGTARAPDPRPTISLKEALVQVMRASERPLTSQDIVDRVIAIRPGSPDPSIRSEISRARKLGVIRLQGDPRGGTYTANIPRASVPAQRHRVTGM